MPDPVLGRPGTELQPPRILRYKGETVRETYARDYCALWRSHWWWRARHQTILNAMDRFRPTCRDRKPRILDIGCAGGVAFDDLSRYGSVSGIEPDPGLAGSCPEWSSRVRMETFGPDYVSKEKYDIVLLLDVLEHIADDCGALVALRRLSDENAIAVITVPALNCLWSAHDVVNHHFRRYQRAELRGKLLAAQFRVLTLRYFFTWSLPLMMARRILCRSTPGQIDTYQVRVPPIGLNTLFYYASRFEEAIVGSLRIAAPTGSSLLAVVTPNEAPVT